MKAGVVAYDQQFFADIDASEDIEVIGFDPAENAIAYGVESGLLNEGFAINLETEPLSALAKEKLAPVDLVVSTGCVGYLRRLRIMEGTLTHVIFGMRSRARGLTHRPLLP